MARIQKRLWTWIFGGLLAVSLLCCGTSIGFAQPNEILLDHTGAFPEKQRTAVNFPHGLHMESLNCLDCHHRYQKGKNVLDEMELEEGANKVTCDACHNLQSAIKLREAFHHQCMGCHIALRKAGKKTGPELCGECHPGPEEATK